MDPIKTIEVALNAVPLNKAVSDAKVLACAYPHEAWVEHIEWLEPAFNERMEIKHGRMVLPQRPGLDFSLSAGRAVARRGDLIQGSISPPNPVAASRNDVSKRLQAVTL